jgi:hypothetical protein
MHDLPEPMHTRICAARYHGTHGRLREFAQRPFQFVLHCPTVRLRLPTAECRAVVLDA